MYPCERDVYRDPSKLRILPAGAAAIRVAAMMILERGRMMILKRAGGRT
jgi:hypothetical protein